MQYVVVCIWPICHHDELPGETNLITLFSWNEWVEGSYLLPDMKYGFSYLEAVRRVISGEYDPYSK